MNLSEENFITAATELRRRGPLVFSVGVVKPTVQRPPRVVLRFFCYLALTVGATFAIATCIALVAAYEVEMITRSHRIVLEQMR